MDDEAILDAKIAIRSRFESQSAIDDAKARREQQWKEAYDRIGQAPPEREEEPVHDGRTLYEKVKAAEDAKTAEWDEKMKLSNQYRGINEEEFLFLQERENERKGREAKVREEEQRELASYREALAAKNAALDTPPDESKPSSSSSSPAPSAPRFPPKAIKKDMKSLMKGVVVKKKPKAEPAGKGQTVSALSAPLPRPTTPATTAGGAGEKEEPLPGISVVGAMTPPAAGVKRQAEAAGTDDRPVSVAAEGKRQKTDAVDSA